MKDSREFLGYWVVNSFVFYFAPFVFNNMVMTGNARLTPFLSSIISGFFLTVFAAVTHPAFTSLKIKFKEEWQWTVAYLFVNVLGVWFLARYADLTGIGVINAWMAVCLGVIFNLSQWSIRRLVAYSDKK